MRFEALFEALFDVMQPPEGSIPPPLPGQIGVPFRRPGRRVARLLDKARVFHGVKGCTPFCRQQKFIVKAA